MLPSLHSVFTSRAYTSLSAFSYTCSSPHIPTPYPFPTILSSRSLFYIFPPPPRIPSLHPIPTLVPLILLSALLPYSPLLLLPPSSFCVPLDIRPSPSDAYDITNDDESVHQQTLHLNRGHHLYSVGYMYDMCTCTTFYTVLFYMYYLYRTCYSEHRWSCVLLCNHNYFINIAIGSRIITGNDCVGVGALYKNVQFTSGDIEHYS